MAAVDEKRYMWLMVFFDLPVTSQQERKVASYFRRFLIRDGYVMMQFSVYARPCLGNSAVEKHIGRLQINLPNRGNVRALKVTDKQYSKMKLFLGDFKKNEIYGSNQLCFF